MANPRDAHADRRPGPSSAGTGRAASAVPKGLRTGVPLLSNWVLPGAVLVFCLASCARLIAEQASRLFLLGEAGWGDVYVFHTVRQFQKTGVIYQDIARELPAAYGPVFYTVMAIPGRFLTGENPLLGPRLLVIAAFLLCVAVVASITRALIPHRKVWVWSVPLALSFASMSIWVLQIRADFMGIFFSLLAVRLLMTRRLGPVLLAGACAGFATQFKFTYLAALGAGLLWLVANRRWKALAFFSLAGGVTSIGIYGLFLSREPRLLDNVLALRGLLLDPAGAGKNIYHIVREPIALLGLSALPFLRWRLRGRWTLLVLFAAISFGIAAITQLAAGANTNYFFEFLFGLAPLAALGMLKLRRSVFGVAGLWLSGLVLICLAAPIGVGAFTAARTWPEETRVQNLEMTALQRAFRDQTVLALVPKVAFFTPEIFLSDTFTASAYERLGRFDLHPLARRIRNQTFDLIVTPQKPTGYRGVAHLSPTLRPAIAEAYRPFCLLKDWVMFLPRNSTTKGPLNERLVALGCNATACLEGPLCRSW